MFALAGIQKNLEIIKTFAILSIEKLFEFFENIKTWTASTRKQIQKTLNKLHGLEKNMRS